ncbi:hypothetical protein MKX01_024020 [Papaver californicum]|nr:hypothetical protein MKX01_024020 [Papaver californicum]
MKGRNLLDSNDAKFPNFSKEKHQILCSELKQLYDAITRTRQRLWICENIDDFSKPIKVRFLARTAYLPKSNRDLIRAAMYSPMLLSRCKKTNSLQGSK